MINNTDDDSYYTIETNLQLQKTLSKTESIGTEKFFQLRQHSALDKVYFMSMDLLGLSE